MLLENKFYHIINIEKTGEGSAVYELELLPECDVYRGHFPGKPVSPGVCEIETVKELAMSLTGRKLFIATVGQCRFKAVASPQACPKVKVSLEVSLCSEGCYKVLASIADAGTVYMEFKGEMKESIG